MAKHGDTGAEPASNRANAAGNGNAVGNSNGEDLTAEALDLVFVTKNVSEAEQAAVVATLAQMRVEETLQVKKVARRANEPWRRSQRNPEGINEFVE